MSGEVETGACIDSQARLQEEALHEQTITGGENTSSTFSALHRVEPILEWYSGDTGLGSGNRGPLPGGLGVWKTM